MSDLKSILHCDEELPADWSPVCTPFDDSDDELPATNNSMYDFYGDCPPLTDLFLMAPMCTDAATSGGNGDETDLLPGAILGLCALRHAAPSPPATPTIEEPRDSGTPHKRSDVSLFGEHKRYPARIRSPAYAPLELLY